MTLDEAPKQGQVYLAALNREGWLTALVEKLRPFFVDHELLLPETLHVSVGFPSRAARSTQRRRIGECWANTCSADGAPQILISPVLADVVDVGATLVHELVHAAVGVEHGHKSPFVKAMKKIGLEGKPTATVAGDELKDRLVVLTKAIGDYPHPALTFTNAGRKPQQNRQIKLVCPDHIDYIVRASRKTIDLAPPRCGLCETEMNVA